MIRLFFGISFMHSDARYIKNKLLFPFHNRRNIGICKEKQLLRKKKKPFLRRFSRINVIHKHLKITLCRNIFHHRISSKFLSVRKVWGMSHYFPLVKFISHGKVNSFYISDVINILGKISILRPS